MKKCEREGNRDEHGVKNLKLSALVGYRCFLLLAVGLRANHLLLFSLLINSCSSLFFFCSTVDCARIVSVSKSQSVKNNTASVVLDCEFIFNEEMDQKLVLKW